MIVNAAVYYLGRIFFPMGEKQIKGAILNIFHFVNISRDNLF